ncbi:YebC/PmpR family DNA-binding transcriptional regulator [Candidatus Parcubacteria bacterium]|nr:YebC/PmpR family DNA-binding transcriptional regulator [Candidatus Parcubacteria bacterium]
MSGHSKWSTIKRTKGATDAKRAVVFTKLAKQIILAAKEKGGNIETNFSLKMAVDKAKSANMPKDNIEKAIKRATGELEDGQIEELIYEGIGPANSQFIIKALTDNKNRTAANIRHIFSKHGGSLGNVMWNFEQKGVIQILNTELQTLKIDFDEFELELIDAGADDIFKEDDNIIVYTAISDLQKIKKFLEDKKINTELIEMQYITKEELKLSSADETKVEKLIDALEDNEDVGDYYSNVNV